MKKTENEMLGLPAAAVELSDDEIDDYSGAAWSTPACVAVSVVSASIKWCTDDTVLWGSCRVGTRGCC